MTEHAAARLRALVAQLRLPREECARLLRDLADELDSATLDSRVQMLAECEAKRLRDIGITVTTGLEVGTLGAATILGRTAGTLRNWRSAGVGPHWRSDGGVVWYSLAVLIDWRPRASRTVTIQSQADV